MASVVNEATRYKARARHSQIKALDGKAKANNLDFEAKANNFGLKDKSKAKLESLAGAVNIRAVELTR